MRAVLTVLGLVGLLTLSALLYVAIVLRPLPAVVVESDPVVASASGAFEQSGVLVGRAEVTADGSTSRVALALPGEEVFINGELTFRFPQNNARELVAAEVHSIQGDLPFQLEWETGNQLRVTMRGVIPEGYPVLVLRAPEGFFAISPLNQLAQRLVSAPIEAWLVAALMLIVLSGIILRIKTRTLRWQVAGERSAPPGDMRPLELAMLHHSTLKASDFAAFLFDLAERGYLEIVVRSEEDILFLRSSNQDGLSGYEKNFLLMLFPESNTAVSLAAVTDSLNQELFSAVVSQFYVDVNDGFTNRGFFRDSPRLVHLRYKTAGIIVQLAGLAGAVVSYWFANQSIPGLVILCGAVYIVGLLLYGSGNKVVPLSRIGGELVTHCAEFQNYLVSTKPFLSNESAKIFYTYLPHAVVLGVAQPWMNRFIQHVQWYIPKWYTSFDGEVVRADQFVNQVEVIAGQLAKVLVAVKDPNVD